MEHSPTAIRLRMSDPDMLLEFSKEQIIEWFQYVYFYSSASQNPISYFGWALQKNPMDLWVYQELIVRNQPDVIIETGSGAGGSALYMAVICDILNQGRIISIDIKARDDRAQHPRIEYITADSADKNTLEHIHSITMSDNSIMVILDSDHTKPHVIKELDNYGPLVTKNQYLIIEDTEINGHPIGPNFGPGPWEAIEEWLPQHPEFIQDKDCERFLLTWNQNGYLKRT